MTHHATHDLPSDTPPPPRRVFGVRPWALLEIALPLGAMLAADALFFTGDRFMQIAPHPFWVVVLLAAAHYGTAEGLAAVVLASLGLLVGNVPQQGLEEDFYEWIGSVTLQPILWFVAAAVIGEMQTARARERDRLAGELAAAHQREMTITAAYERQSRIREELERRIAGQMRTVHSIYTASRAIERLDIGEVLLGAGDLVRAVMAPGKFSLFLLDRGRLEAALSDGWTPEDRFQRAFDASSPLFQAVLGERRRLSVLTPADAAILDGEGVLAGPLISGETGRIIGMLKIEALDFLGLNPTSVQNFDTLRHWIGAAYDRAERHEATGNAPDAGGREDACPR